MTDEQRPDDHPVEDHQPAPAATPTPAPAPTPAPNPTPWWSGPARDVWDTRPDPQPSPTSDPAPDHEPAHDRYDTLFDDTLFGSTRDEPTRHDVWAPTDTLGREPKPSTSRVGLLVALAAAIALVAGVAGGAAGFLLAEHDSSSQTVDGASLGAAPARHVDRPAGSVPGVAAAVLPSVVQIKVETSQGQATGSGFVVDETGVVVTNNHVVADSQGDVVLSFSDGRTTTAKVVGTSASYDLAVLRIDAKNLPALTLGNSDGVAVGDPVLAVGSPLGLSGTVTSGIVSAKNRPVTAGGDQGGDSAYINAIQTDAAINPGNSGGPLVNLDGEVIGVNSAIATVGGAVGGESGNIGVGFAIPINQVRRTVEQLLGKGQAEFPIIGASLDGGYDGEGARIAADDVQGNPPIVPGGPAQQAGLQPGDVILSLDGTKVEGNAELIVAIRAKRPGDTVTLRVRRDGAEHDVRVTLGSHQG
jgi:putative serine protease PepD